MNKAYRLVWSDRLGSFVAAPECARACGKSSVLVQIVALAFSVLCWQPAGAQVAADPSKTQITNAANGVPVVNIATTNAAGVSHNQYNNFNVNAQGLVLNNNAAANAAQTQLAGSISRNANLGGNAAKLILNEVVVAGRSALNGFMEVAGSRADVVVANPWGITCNGCGFINTDRATLSTGTPVFASDGSLAGLRVNQGDILINGTGLDGRSQNILDLVARSVVVSGEIKADDLKLIAGNNEYSYANRTPAVLAASGTQPYYAIDSTALGGMYAQKIAIIATERGVGVNMLGNAAARGSDFTLTADGHIQLSRNTASATRNLAITSTGGKIFLNSTTVSAGENLSLKTSDSDIDIQPNSRIESSDSMNLSTGSTLRNYGLLTGAGDMSINADISLSNLGTIEAGRLSFGGGGWLINQGRISSARGFKLDTSNLTNGSTSNSGARIESTLDNGSSTYASSITARSDVINFGAIHTRDNLSISSGKIYNQNTGGITSNRALNLTAADFIYNYGALYSGDRGLNLNATTINNYNSGTVEAVTGITSDSAVFNNYGVIRAEDIAVVARTSFYNGLETPITAVMDFSTQVPSSENQPRTQIDFWQEDKTCARCNESWLYQDAVTYREIYSSPLPSVKPQMLALSTLTLDYQNGTATNYAGILSGDLVSITGKGAFTNQDVSLAEVTYNRRAAEYKEDHWHWAYGALYTSFAATAKYPLSSAALSNEARTQLPKYKNIAEALENSNRFEKSRVTYSTTGAGVYANALYVSTGQLANLGSPLGYNDSRLTQGGFSVVLPTNPNGHYILSGDPKSRYLIITNPDFKNEVAGLTTDALEKALGFSPDDALLRLGDDGYEDFQIEQQLINTGAAQLLVGNEASLINQLRTNALAEAGNQKLVYGAELTPDQIKNLSKDIVWMVKTKVQTKTGTKEVLVPRVYLSESTRAIIHRGTVMAAKKTTIDAASVSNQGGLIAGTQNLSVKTTGNIDNASGTITGGDISLAAKGNIINKTVTEGHGDSRDFKTTIGKTGKIEATTGSLVLSAGQDIKVEGAEVRAAKSATVAAVGAITVDSVVNKSTTSTSESSLLKKEQRKNTTSSKNSTITSENRIGSTVSAGESISITSGGDVTIKGSKTDAPGGIHVTGKGDIKVLADQNKTMTHVEAKNAGRGIGGGLWGKKKQTTDSAKSTNAGSTIATAGNANIGSDKKLTIQGSQVKVGGDAHLNARQGISILDGKNESKSTTKTETTTFLKVGDGKGTQASAKKPLTEAGATHGQASAKAEVGVEASSRHDIKLLERTTTTEKSSETHSAGATLSVGGTLNANTDKTLKVQGSSIQAGKAVNLNAGQVNVAAGDNSKETSTDTKRFSIGIYEESGARANAQARSEARGSEASVGGAASASASARASAESNVTIGFKKENESQKDSAKTHTSAVIQSGGDMKVTAKGDATFTGANVNSGGNLDVSAASIHNNAVKDVRESTSSKASHLAGINYGAAASAGASANAGVQGGIGASAEAAAKIEGKVEATAGLRYKNEQEASKERKETQVTNTFSAGKDITRTATDTIRDQGTQMQAGGSIDQKARVITDQAVSNSSSSSKTSQFHDARIGVYAGASAEAGASANATLIGKSDASAKTEAKAGIGVKASYLGSNSAKEEQKQTAVTSNYKAGKDISSTSTEKTTLEGARFDAANNVNIKAGTLDVKAAKDTSSSSDAKHNTNAQLTVTIMGTPGVDASAMHRNKSDSASTSNERAGTIKAGGNISIHSGGDANFTGTQITSKDKTNINAQGNVNFNAAQNTSKSSSQIVNANGGISVGGSSMSGNLGAAYGNNKKSSTTGEGSKIDGKGGIDINAGKNATFEGAKLTTSGDANITARDKIQLLETTRRETQMSLSVGAGIKGKASEETPKRGGTPANEPTPDRAGQGNRPGAGAGNAGTGSGAHVDRQNSGRENASVRDESRPTVGTPPNTPQPDPVFTVKPPTTGLNAGLANSDKTKGTATSIDATGKINIQAGSVVNQEAKTTGQQVNVSGVKEEKAKTNKNFATGFEITVGAPTRKNE